MTFPQFFRIWGKIVASFCPTANESAGGKMSDQTLAIEAHKCRNLALRYSGSPEERLLINLAAAFEELARKRNGNHRFS